MNENNAEQVEGNLLTITENGFGRRSPIQEYGKAHLGGRGIRTIVTNDRNGKICFMGQVFDEDEIMIATKNGMVLRVPVKDIRIQGRNTSGVKLINIDEEDKIVSVAIIKELEELQE